MPRTIEVSNMNDVIDSRDVIARIEELESDEQIDADDAAELETLRALAKQGEDYADDWQYGAQLIRDTYFKAYAQELAEEYDMIPRDAKWPLTCIDWDKAASDLKMEYSAIDFGGVTYWTQ